MSAGTTVLVGRLFPLMKAAMLLHHVGLQRRAGRPEVAAAGRRNPGGPGAVTAGRGPRPEVVRALELLREQR